jgi:hypothetical protein
MPPCSSAATDLVGGVSFGPKDPKIMRIFMVFFLFAVSGLTATAEAQNTCPPGQYRPKRGSECVPVGGDEYFCRQILAGRIRCEGFSQNPSHFLHPMCVRFRAKRTC